jgi:hypothetical protein
MSVPISQMWTVASYVLKQRLRGRDRYPLVLMLAPLFRCNLACAGCIDQRHMAAGRASEAGRRLGRLYVDVQRRLPDFRTEPVRNPMVASTLRGYRS